MEQASSAEREHRLDTCPQHPLEITAPAQPPTVDGKQFVTDNQISISGWTVTGDTRDQDLSALITQVQAVIWMDGWDGV